MWTFEVYGTPYVSTPVKTILELFRPAFEVLPKTGNTEPVDQGKPGWERLRTICTGLILAWRWQGGVLWIDWHGVNLWRRLRLRDMLRRERVHSVRMIPFLCLYAISSIVLLLILVTVAIWLSGNVVGHINKVTLHWAGLVLRWVTVHPSHPGQLNLVTPQWVGEMSTSDGYGYR